MRTAWVGAMIGSALLALPAAASTGDDAIPMATTTALAAQGMAAIEASDPNRAIELVRPILASFERDHATEKRQMFCALTPQQSAAYLADAAQAKHDAVTVGGDWCRAQYVNAYALIDLGRYDEARGAFERLVGFAPRNSRYLNELGFVLIKQRNWARALEAYNRAEAAADLTPDRTLAERCLALKGIGYSKVELGDLLGAAAAYRRCLALDPNDKDAGRELDYVQQQWRATA